MCGLAGAITRDADRAARLAEEAARCQAHRGPDDAGLVVAEAGPHAAVALAHRRLSIIDLSDRASEPMIHPDTGDVLVFNGEIYNFRELRTELETAGARFRSDGDTEVLLNALVAWGDDAVARLAGMYAFALYRPASRTVLLARDPLGIKPLYHTVGGDTFAFASEVQALVRAGLSARSLDRAALAGLLAYGAVQEPLTIFSDLRSLPAGATMVVDATDPGTPAAPRRFWSYPSRAAAVTPQEAVAATRELLDVAVRQHLVADVPVGIFLSSGIDSTAVAGLTARHDTAISTFTVSFHDNRDMSEGRMSARTAAEFGLEHHDVAVSTGDALELCQRWLLAQDQPCVDGLNVYVVSAAVKERGMTVALSGQGGDEVFGGYASYADVPRVVRLRKSLGWAPPRVRRLVGGLATMRRPQAAREKMQDMLGSGGGLLDAYLHRRRLLSDQQMVDLGLRAGEVGTTAQFLPHDAPAELTVVEDDPAWSISKLETLHYLRNTLLRESDVNGMAHSLEIRVPLLDQRVVDALLALPGDVRMPSGGGAKHLLRASFPELYRPELLAQGKRGFTLPVRRWMLGPLRDMCESALGHLRRIGVVRPAAVDDVWQAFLRQPESSAWSRAWLLVVTGARLQRYGV